jgi:hypothetical protein
MPTDTAPAAPKPKAIKRYRTQLEEFEAGLGGRHALTQILELAALDRKQEHLLNLLHDPERSRDTLDTIARDAGLKPAHVMDLIRSSAFARAQAHALLTAAAAIPGVMRDLADKAVDVKVECPTCFGAKEIAPNVKCPQCWGKGEILRTSDLDRQKILLDTVGIIKKSQGGVNVNVNQQVGITQPGGFFSSMIKATDADAYDVTVTEAELLPPATPSKDPHGQ